MNVGKFCNSPIERCVRCGTWFASGSGGIHSIDFDNCQESMFFNCPICHHKYSRITDDVYDHRVAVHLRPLYPHRDIQTKIYLHKRRDKARGVTLLW